MRKATIEDLRHAFSYDPETGNLTRRVKPLRGSGDVGDIAGDVKSNGYRYVGLKNDRFLAHRVIWAMVHGEWPDLHVDHINGDRADNRLGNLRQASRWDNNRNSVKKSNNTSGYKGVCWNKQRSKWQANIRVWEGHRSRSRHLGLFETIEGAAMAYAIAAKQLHGAYLHQDTKAVLEKKT